jgi:hypothetical protein
LSASDDPGRPRCPECGGPLTERRACWGCCERICPCGRPTGSAFIRLCCLCGLREPLE